MLNSGKKKKYSNSCVVRKKILNETKNHNPSFKLNGRSLSWIYLYNQCISTLNVDSLPIARCNRYNVMIFWSIWSVIHMKQTS